MNNLLRLKRLGFELVKFYKDWYFIIDSHNGVFVEATLTSRKLVNVASMRVLDNKIYRVTNPIDELVIARYETMDIDNYVKAQRNTKYTTPTNEFMYLFKDKFLFTSPVNMQLSEFIVMNEYEYIAKLKTKFFKDLANNEFETIILLSRFKYDFSKSNKQKFIKDKEITHHINKYVIGISLKKSSDELDIVNKIYENDLNSIIKVTETDKKYRLIGKTLGYKESNTNFKGLMIRAGDIVVYNNTFEINLIKDNNYKVYTIDKNMIP